MQSIIVKAKHRLNVDCGLVHLFMRDMADIATSATLFQCGLSLTEFLSAVQTSDVTLSCDTMYLS